MKYCSKCEKEHPLVFDYCSDCGNKLLNIWRYKCLDCGHGADIPAKYCYRCGSNYIIANKEIENEESWVRE